MTWLLAAIVLVAGLLAVRGCSGGQGSRSVVEGAPRAGSNSANTTAQAAVDANTDVAARALTRQRDDAMYAAVGTLQRYMAALGSDDRAKADAFWVDGRPAANGEADLRTLQALRGLRIENGTPKPMDAAQVPSALEIPVTLRVSLQDAPMRRYSGWYRLRQAVTGDRWEITSASIDRVPGAP